MAKKKNTVPQNITLDQFRSWLQGVEDMQTDDWAPTSEQWRVIREKIDLIVGPDESMVAAVPQRNMNQYPTQLPPQPIPQTYLPPLPPVMRPQLETAVIINSNGQPSTIAVEPAMTRSEFE